MTCTNLIETLNFLRKKNSVWDSTEIPDREITVAFTNLIESLNLSRRERIDGMKRKFIFSRDQDVVNVVLKN